MYYANDNKYVGSFDCHYLHGKGVYYYANGDKYKGTFVDNKPHGKGVYYWADGSSAKQFYENGNLIESE